MMIRILHIVHALTNGGGLSNFVMNYYRKIDRRKIQFDFVYFKETNELFKNEIIRSGGRVFKWTEPSLDLKYRKEARDFFKAHSREYIAIHCHALFAVAAYGKTAKKYGVKNIIAHSHNIGYGENGWVRNIRNRYFVFMCRYFSDYQFACSTDAAVFMFGKKNYNAGKVLIIKNAVDCEKFYFNERTRDEVRKELQLHNCLTIGHVGGFTKQKNHQFLISLFYKYLTINPNSKLVLVGGNGLVSGATMPEMMDLVQRLGISEKVIFTGLRDDVNRIMMGMDLFLFPSTFEGFGLVLVEAQASGLKCIASDRVPSEAKCTERITYLPLENEDKWINEIKNTSIHNRKVNKSDFLKYDIGYNAEKLERFYVSLT